MSGLGPRARDAREAAIERAIVDVVGEDALQSDLSYALDELLAQEDNLAIHHLATAVEAAAHAESNVVDHRREEDRGRLDRTEGEESAETLIHDAREALDDYVRERVEDRIEDATEWLGGDVALDDLVDEDEEVEDR